MNAIKNYIVTNKMLNILLFISILVIISFQLSKNLAPLFDLDVGIVNYYYEILVNISLGYIVSTIFYIIVIYYPERKKKYLVNVTTRRIIARLQTNLRSYIDSIIESCGVKIMHYEDVRNDYIPKIRDFNLLDLMGSCYNEDYRERGDNTKLKVAVRSAREIENLKRSLIPFLAYLEYEELNFYSDLDDILIFENMNELDLWPPKDQLMIDDFPLIVDVYYKCQKLIGTYRRNIEWEPDDFE